MRSKAKAERISSFNEWEATRTRLEEWVCEPRLLLPHSLVLAPAEPFTLLIRDAERSKVAPEPQGGRGEALRIPSALERSPWTLKPLFRFYWESMGPSRFGESLHLLDAGSERSYLLRFRDDDDPVVLGAVEPKLSRPALQAFFECLIGSDGRHFRIDGYWNRLPGATFNYVPELVPAGVVVAAFLGMIESSESIQWSDLIARLEEANEGDSARLRDILKKLRTDEIMANRACSREVGGSHGRSIRSRESLLVRAAKIHLSDDQKCGLIIWYLLCTYRERKRKRRRR